MQLARSIWSSAKASDCNRYKVTFQGEQVSTALALDSSKVCIQEGAFKELYKNFSNSL